MDSNIIKPGNQTLEEFYCFNFFFYGELIQFQSHKRKNKKLKGENITGSIIIFGRHSHYNFVIFVDYRYSLPQWLQGYRVANNNIQKIMFFFWVIENYVFIPYN